METKLEKFEASKNIDVDVLINKEKDPVAYMVVSDYKAGKSKAELMNKFGVSKRYINNTFKKYDISFRPAGQIPIDEATTAKIIEKYKAGETENQISIELEVDDSTISKILKKAGVETKNAKFKKARENMDNEYLDKKFYTKEVEPLTYDNQFITESYLSSLSKEEREPIAEHVFNYFREHGFPYPNYEEKELRNDWDNLLRIDSSRAIKGNVLNGNFTCGLYLFKHFSHNFYQAKRKDKDHSYVEAFNNDQLLMKCIRNRMGITYKEIFNITPAMIKQGLRNSYCCSSCSIFNPTIAKYIYDTYAPADGIVYDYSIGFGQRALGALSSGNHLTYIGCDPEEKCVENLKTMADFLGRSDKIHIEQIGSETFCPKKYEGKVDLAFSSPPYFNLEYYSDSENQAYAKGFDYFINVYWKKTMDNIDKLLKSGGRFVLNITEDLHRNMKASIESKGYVLETTLEIQLSKNTNYKTKENKTEPVYVYKKG